MSDQSGPAAVPPRSALETLRSNLGAVTLMVVAVGLQVAGAVLLKTIANHHLEWSVAAVCGVVGAVVLVDLMRLGVWGLAHRRFPLSSTFPLSSLFYPAMLGVAAGFGDVVGVRQIVGALLITGGTVWLSSRVRA